ncbi:MAG: WYL domain-containing protein [Fretibacterium sp.]|nr:WYL domain-containing protein [Fretibacterium sp.]
MKFITLLAALPMLWCAVSGAWAAPDGEVGLQLEGLVRTDEERNADLQRAFSEISGDVSEEDQVRLKRGLRISKSNFLRLYQEHWRSENMARKLERTVNEAFNEQTRDLMTGTAAIQMATNEELIENIQNAVNFKFSPTQEDFLAGIEAEFGLILQKEVRNFFNEVSAYLLANARNPMVRAGVRELHNRVVRDNEQAIMKLVHGSLRDKYPDLLMETGISGGFKAAVGVGLLTYYVKKRLAAHAARSVGKKIAKHSLGKIVGMGIPIIGWGLMAWSLYDFYSLSEEAKTEARQQLNAMNQAMYYEQVPEVYWDKMEPFVLDNYLAALTRIQEMGEQAEKLAKDPRIAALSEGLSDVARLVFSERMANAVTSIGVKDGDPVPFLSNEKDYDDLLTHFGTLIRDASPDRFEWFVDMLRWNSLSQIRTWLSLAGEDAYFDIYASFPREILAQFPPTEESLKALSWMAHNLTLNARKLACSLPASDLRWVMEELPGRFVPHLFGEEHDIPAIRAEIARLREIPDCESRAPWQGVWEYRWSRYGFYIIAAVVALIAAMLLRPLISLVRFFAGRKEHNKKESHEKNITPTPFVINFPQIVPAGYSTGSPAYAVKLKVSEALAQDLSTISWNMTQTVLPCDEDSGARILSVQMEDLGGIARWVARHREDIEVLQPEELRLAVANIQEEETKGGGAS